MIGALGKLIGGIVVIAAALALVIGPAVAMYGINEQSSNEEGGALGEDKEQTQSNGAIVVAGAATSLAGIGVAVIGLILVGLGAATTNGMVRRKTRIANEDIARMEAM